MSFTLVIPTRNRPELLLRQLRHYSGFPIIIADSSYEWLDGKPTEDFRVVGYAENTPIFEKLNDVLCLVKTPLVVIGADDDVFDVGGLHKAAAFLNENPSYASCSGQMVTVEPNGAIAHYPQRSIEDALPFDRITHHMSHYTTKWYSMQRTADVKTNYALTLAANVDETYLGELLPSCLSVMDGMSNVLDDFYMVRRVWPDRPKKMSKKELVSRPEWLGETIRFSNAIHKSHCEVTQLLDLWLYAPKRSWLRCGWDNWLAEKWAAKAKELLS